jgi:hypothetical protein
MGIQTGLRGSGISVGCGLQSTGAVVIFRRCGGKISAGRRRCVRMVNCAVRARRMGLPPRLAQRHHIVPAPPHDRAAVAGANPYLDSAALPSSSSDGQDSDEASDEEVR